MSSSIRSFMLLAAPALITACAVTSPLSNVQVEPTRVTPTDVAPEIAVRAQITLTPTPSQTPLPPQDQTSTAEAAIISTQASLIRYSMTHEAEAILGTVAPADSTATVQAIMAGLDQFQQHPELMMTAIESITGLDQVSDDYAALEGSCTGIAWPGSTPYEGGPGRHPIEFINRGLDSTLVNSWSELRPLEWRPPSRPSTQLVACIMEERQLIETCPYSLSGAGWDATIKRWQHSVTIRLVAPSDGRILEEKVFYGSTPDSCPASASFSGRGDVIDYEGITVPYDEFAAWLTPYVAPES